MTCINGIIYRSAELLIGFEVIAKLFSGINSETSPQPISDSSSFRINSESFVVVEVLRAMISFPVPMAQVHIQVRGPFLTVTTFPTENVSAPEEIISELISETAFLNGGCEELVNSENFGCSGNSLWIEYIG